MYKLKYLILVIVVILGLGCSKREEKGGSSASNMKLSDINSNLQNKKIFVTSESNNFSNFRSHRSELNSISSSNIKNLAVINGEGDIDYGLLSDYDLNVDKIKIDYKNEYAYALLKFYNEGSSSDSNIKGINCTILKIKIINGEISCLVNGVVVMSQITHARFTRNAYVKPLFQFSDNGNIYFRGERSEGLNVNNDLSCSNSCLYEFNSNQEITLKINNDSEQEVSRLLALNDGQVVYTGWKLENGQQKYNGSEPLHSEIIIRESNGDEHNITSTNASIGGGYHADINKGENLSLIYGSEKSSKTVISRVVLGEVKKTYVQLPFSSTSIIKADTGEIYSHGNDGLYRLLPNSKKIIDNPSEIKGNLWNIERCGDSLTCFIYYKIINGIIFYNHINYNYKNKPTTIKATRLSDNKTISVIESDSNCSDNCYKINFINEPDASTAAYKLSWYDVENKLFISMKNMNTNLNEILEINADSLDFNSGSNQYSIQKNLSNILSARELKSVSGVNIDYSSISPSATIRHEDNDTVSVRIEFNKKMNYSDVESKIIFIDNASNNNVGFMPFWNNKTLHLVVDTDNGTVFDDNTNTLTSGTTYKLTLLGSAKDSDGNIIGSDVVKYFTP